MRNVSVSSVSEVDDKQTTGRIIACAYKVHQVLGSGFNEKVYENALAIELRKRSFSVQQQWPINVFYAEENVGDFYADILVDNTIICELKAIEKLTKIHDMQLVNYLAATGFETGLLFNFGKSVEVRRKFRTYKKPVNPEKSC